MHARTFLAGTEDVCGNSKLEHGPVGRGLVMLALVTVLERRTERSDLIAGCDTLYAIPGERPAL